jgi:hypothetical protein
MSFSFAAYALHDDLLCRLRRDTPEVFRRDFLVEVIADLILRAGFFRSHLELRIADFVGDGTPVEDAVFPGLPVDGHDCVGFAAEVSLVCGQQRRFQRLDQHLERNVAFFRDELQDVDEPFFGCFSHGSCVLSVLLAYPRCALHAPHTQSAWGPRPSARLHWFRDSVRGP